MGRQKRVPKERRESGKGVQGSDEGAHGGLGQKGDSGWWPDIISGILCMFQIKR